MSRTFLLSPVFAAALMYGGNPSGCAEKVDKKIAYGD
jgi:hypothetical protein